MNTDNLTISVALNILKPVNQVYEAIVDPDKMKGYFIGWGSERMASNKTVEWMFPEMDMKFPVKVVEASLNRSVRFQWGDEAGEETTVEISFRERGEETYVQVTESSRPLTDAGLKWFRQNTEGWANFLCCLKAYVEYGINLRKGAFLPEQMPQ